MRTNKEKGALGEKLAETYLISKGYNILEKNFLCLYGEIDIIAEKENVYVFVEVKFRKNLKFGTPAEAVDYRKQLKIKNTALFYLQKNEIEKDIRFDVAELLETDKIYIRYLENAF